MTNRLFFPGTCRLSSAMTECVQIILLHFIKKIIYSRKILVKTQFTLFRLVWRGIYFAKAISAYRLT